MIPTLVLKMPGENARLALIQLASLAEYRQLFSFRWSCLATRARFSDIRAEQEVEDIQLELVKEGAEPAKLIEVLQKLQVQYVDPMHSGFVATDCVWAT
jgi:hypothetical protein